MLYRFRDHPLSCKFFSTLGHHAELNAPSTSRLTVTVISPLLNPSCTNSFTAIIASIVLVCGMNPYWFLFRNSVEWMWWFILFINAPSSIFPPMLRRLIGRYFVTSWLFCVSGFVIGMMYICMYVFMCMYVCLCVCICMCVCVSMYVYVCIMYVLVCMCVCFLWFIIRHDPLHSAVLHAILISYYMDFTLLYILFSFPWTLSLLSSLLYVIKVYYLDKGSELLLVLRCEVLFSHWPGSYLLLNDFPLCAKVWTVEQEMVHWLVFVLAAARRFFNQVEPLQVCVRHPVARKHCCHFWR